MKQKLLLTLFLITFCFSGVALLAQSAIIDPNFVQIPKVASLPSCVVADKGKAVFNNTDNKMYYCDGMAWQSMAANSTTTPPTGNPGFGNWNECLMPNITDYQPLIIQEGETYANYNFTISGDWAVIHVNRPSNSNLNARLMFYKINGNSWEHYETILEPATSNGYGQVDMFNNILIVGDFDANHFYEFDGNNWILKQTLNSSFLGTKVSIDNGVAISGTNNNVTILSNQFVNNNWQIVFQEAIFGVNSNINAVDISGDFAVVSTNNRVIIYQDQYQGGQYSFNAIQEIFGNSTSISILGYNLIIGNSLENGVDINFNSINQSGQAVLYEYKNGTFIFIQVFSDSNANTGEQFGISVKLSGDYLLISAIGKKNVPIGYGISASFLYKKQQNLYVKIETILNPTFSNMGSNCDIDGVSKRFAIGNYIKQLIFGKVKF
jgi:FG-GAP repeat